MSYARTALITGSTSGIGRACAETLAREGAHVIVSGRHTERGEHTVDKIRAMGGTADFIAADLGSARSATSLAEKALAVTGSVDILVNNAGIYTFGPTASTTEEAFDAVYDLNVKAPYFLVRALAPAMAARGSGVIIYITTGAAHRGAVGACLYGSSKAALMLLTKGWSAEFGPSGVRVNAISPEPIHTPGTGNDIDHLAASLPARRIGEPHEVASAVAFLNNGRPPSRQPCGPSPRSWRISARDADHTSVPPSNLRMTVRCLPSMMTTTLGVPAAER